MTKTINLEEGNIALIFSNLEGEGFGVKAVHNVTPELLESDDEYRSGFMYLYVMARGLVHFLTTDPELVLEEGSEAVERDGIINISTPDGDSDVTVH